MASTRSKGVIRVVRDFGPQSVGKTDKCSYAKVLKIANGLCEEANNARDQATAEQIIGAGGSA